MTSQCRRALTLARAEKVECGFNEVYHARCLVVAFYLGMAVHSANVIAAQFQRSCAIMCNINVRPESWWGMGGAIIAGK